MTKNVGSIDKWLRVFIGIVLLGVIVTSDSAWRWLGLIGIVPLATALMNWCPLYSLLGINTCPSKKSAA